jgi:hypothetical protein
MTRHMQDRMNQRGISGELVSLALEYGEWQGDKCQLSRKALLRLIANIDGLRTMLVKAIDKGGLTVVESDGSLITTYRGASAGRR